MHVVLIGEGALALRCLRSLESRGLKPDWVACFDGSLQTVCEQQGIAHLHDRQAVASALRASGCDLLFSVRNPWILPADLLATVRGHAINFHDSPLPRYAGMHATSWAIYHGEREHAVSWHEMSASIDTGRLLVQTRLPITPDDTAFTLNTKCFDAAAAGFDVLLVELLESRLQPRVQSGPRSYFGARRRPPALGVIDLASPASAIVNRVRSLDFGHAANPLGLPKLWLGDRALVVGRASVGPSEAGHGSVARVLSVDNGVVRIAAEDGELRLSSLSGPDGSALSTQAVAEALAPWVGRHLPTLAPQQRDAITALHERVCLNETTWRRRLARGISPAGLPAMTTNLAPDAESAPLRECSLPRFNVALRAASVDSRAALARAVVAAHVARASGRSALDLGQVSVDAFDATTLLFTPVLPWRIDFAADQPLDAFVSACDSEWQSVRALGTFARDLASRSPELHGQSAVPAVWPLVWLEGAVRPSMLSLHAACVLWQQPEGGELAMLAPQTTGDEWIEAFDAQWATGVQAALADPMQAVGGLSMVDDAQRERALRSWNQTAMPLPARCVHELVAERARVQPDAPAVSFGDTRLSFAQLDARANQLAHLLRERGVVSGDRVALSLRRSADIVVALLGIMKSGAAYVPIDAAYPRERIQLILDKAQPRLAVADALTCGLLERGGLDLLLVDAQAGLLASQPQTDLAPTVDPESGAYVVFTSGSTGEPKGVEIRHSSLLNHALGVQRHYEFAPGDRILFSASIGFDVAAEQIYPALMHGAEVVVRPENLLESFERFDPFVRSQGLTALMVPTAFWHEWVRQMQVASLEVPPSLRVLAVGTEKALGEHLLAWNERGGQRVRFLQGYGPTEATVTCTMYVHDAADDLRRPLPIGRPLPNTEAYVLDERLEPVAVGMPGELYVGGAGLARGYLGRPDLTAQRFIAHPFSDQPEARLYKTGDIVRYNPDGQLVYIGRADFQVKLRGFRVELGEIEAVLRGHAGVDEVVVLVREDTPGTKRLVAYLVPRPDAAAPAPDVLEALCRERLPDYMVPAAYVLLETLPVNANGKLDRQALPAPPNASRDAARMPRNDAELLVAQAFAEALGVSEIGIDDNFFEHGGDSLAAMLLLSRLERGLSTSLSLEQLMSAPTVATLAASIANGSGLGFVETPSVIQLKAGSGTPLFLVCGIHLYQALARAFTGNNPVFAVLLPVEVQLLRSASPLPSVQELAAGYVKLVRQQAPHGPYALGGSSFGGLVAYEMAQQLRAQGEKVQVLALFDSVLPRGRRWRLLSVVKRRASRWAKTLQAAATGHNDPRQRELDRIDQRRGDGFERALADYDRCILPYAGDAVLYRSQDAGGPVVAHHGFAGLLTGRMATRDCPGDHTGLLQQGNVETLVADLSQRL